MTAELLALAERFPEINPNNYNEDDVIALNNWGCEVFDALRATALRSSTATGGREEIAKVLLHRREKRISNVDLYIDAFPEEWQQALADADAILAIRPIGSERPTFDDETTDWRKIAPELYCIYDCLLDSLTGTKSDQLMETIARVFRQKLDASGAVGMREALEEIDGMTCHLRQGGPDPMDLQELSDALERATSLANDALHSLTPSQVQGDDIQTRRAETELSGHDGSEAKSGWRPIATAPKDGTRILAIRAEYWMPVNGNNRWVYSRTRETFWLAGNERFDFGDEKQPTHWVPVLAPPTLDAPASPTDGDVA